MKLPLALFAGSLLFVSAADAGPRRAFRMSTSAHYLTTAPTAPACEPLESRPLTAGAASWSLSPWNGRGCAAPYGVADTGSHRLQVVHVASRMALALSADAGVAELLTEGGRAVLTTAEGLCGVGTRTGAAIVEPGTYVLRATRVGEGPRALRVEAMAVSQRAVMAGESWVPMSTGASEGDLRCDGDGADVRVLVCPNGRRAVLSAPNGMVASVEGLGSARACFSVAPGQGQAVALPTGALAIVRAWPYGAERGAAVIDLR